MKSADEIKKGLERCMGDPLVWHCDECPYADDEAEADDGCDSNGAQVMQDVLALIQQLESKLNQAVEDIRMLGRTGELICPVCAYYNHGEGTKGECVECLAGDGFRWRGEKDAQV